MPQSLKQLSKTAKVISAALLRTPRLKYQGPVRCPTTGDNIFFNTTKTWADKLQRKGWLHHCTWGGFSYVLFEGETPHKKIPVVEIYRQEGAAPIGLTFDGDLFIPVLS